MIFNEKNVYWAQLVLLEKLLFKLSIKIKKFDILLLTANKNYKAILKQAIKLDVKNIIITDKESYLKSLKLNRNKK